MRRQLDLVLDQEIVEDVEVRVLAPSGQVMQWLSLLACQEQLPDGTVHLSGTIADISRSKSDCLNAQRFNAKKNATLEILSHDLATPLALVQQVTQHLKSQFVETDEANQHLIKLMERICTDGLNLIRDFVNQEFLESASIELKLERTDLAGWVATVLEEYQRSEQHLHFDFVAPQ